MRWKFWRSGPPHSATSANTLRPIWVTAYPMPMISPRPPNASGTAAHITSATRTRAISSSRTGSRSGSSQLVTQAV